MNRPESRVVLDLDNPAAVDVIPEFEARVVRFESLLSRALQSLMPVPPADRLVPRIARRDHD